MRLYEYQCKKIFNEFGINTPKGQIALTANEASNIARDFNSATVIKAQVLVGGRGKAGGIKLAKDPQMAEKISTEILNGKIKGIPVNRLLVEEAIDINKELYLGITIERESRLPLLIASSAGGIEIESIAERTPEKVCKLEIDPFIGIHEYHARNIAMSIDLERKYWEPFVATAVALWTVFVRNDATLIEINPLAITQTKEIVAIDAKMIVDENALFRHPDFEDISIESRTNKYEKEAYKSGFSYVKLDGNVGCIVNGAGLAMATMDLIKLCGGEPANFIDIGGGANAQKVENAYRILSNDDDVEIVLINIFGGITHCDEVAQGIINAIKKGSTNKPMVVRLIGTNSKKASKMLSGKNICTAEHLFEAVQKVVKFGKEITA